MSLRLYNSLTKNKETFEPLKPPNVGMYTCGMTVYDFAHIGHGRKYVGDDVLRRVLTHFGYTVKHVQNITDVGHLVSDEDAGEDKLEKGARKFGKTVWQVAAYFTKHFYDSMDQLNILTPTVICKATDHIREQIALIQTLLDKNFAYQTPEAIYFSVDSFPRYGKLFGQNLQDKKQAVREEVNTGEHKKNPADFALWFKRVGRFSDHAMFWPSPWGDGFPGWHIECSAMSMKYLGQSFDIHTGGIEHLAVHHPNEIAQSEAASGKQFVKYWIHHGHLVINGEKMSKSIGNIVSVEDVVNKGYNPLALRYFYFSANYKKPLNFTWTALDASQKAFSQLCAAMQALSKEVSDAKRTQLSTEKLSQIDALRSSFDSALEDDLNIPKALAVLWETVKSNIPSQDKYELILSFDEIFGLNLKKEAEQKSESVTETIPQSIANLAKKREDFRKNGNYKEADQVRKQIEALGYSLIDTPSGLQISKNS